MFQSHLPGLRQIAVKDSKAPIAVTGVQRLQALIQWTSEGSDS